MAHNNPAPVTPLPQWKINLDNESIVNAISAMSEQDIVNLFETFRQLEYPKISVAKTELERLEHQTIIQAFNRVQLKFINIKRDKKIA